MCKGELLGFTKPLWHECETKWYLKIGTYVVAICNGTQIGLNYATLAKKCILIPSSIAICKRGFFKQNAIKSHLRNRLNLETLDALMWVSLCGLEVMQWIRLSSSTFRETCETEGYLRSIDRFYYLISIFLIFNFLVSNQDCILITQSISFSKVFCNPKLWWHCRINYTCQLSLIFVFENVTWHFGFEVERQMKFVKHTHCLQCMTTWWVQESFLW